MSAQLNISDKLPGDKAGARNSTDSPKYNEARERVIIWQNALEFHITLLLFSTPNDTNNQEVILQRQNKFLDECISIVYYENLLVWFNYN